MFCANCGNELPAKALFCPGCGTNIHEHQTGTQESRQHYQNENVEKKYKLYKLSAKRCCVVGYIILFFGLIWVVYLRTLYEKIHYEDRHLVRNMPSGFNIFTVFGLILVVAGERYKFLLKNKKLCTQCTEWIPKEAVKCKHCGSDVPKENPQEIERLEDSSDAPMAKNIFVETNQTEYIEAPRKATDTTPNVGTYIFGIVIVALIIMMFTNC